MAFDAFPKTLDELKERTLGGAAISILAACLILMLFVSEFRQYRLIETVDQLDVDVTSAAHLKIAINLDLTLPSLPCGEFVVDVVDASGVQQLDVADKLVKLRLDRHGIPQDIPMAIDWGHTLAPAFKHRKLMSVLESLGADLHATMARIDEDAAAEGHDAQTREQHHAHRRQLAHRAVLLQEKLARASAAAEPTAELARALHASEADLSEIKAHIRESKLYAEAQTAHVADNLDSIERNIAKLRAGGVDADSAASLREALRIRLAILQDNLRGFVTPADVERRERYRAIAEGIAELANSTRLVELGKEERADALGAVGSLEESLDELATGAAGGARADAERRLTSALALLRDLLVGAPLSADYCGSCYGAERTAGECCNSCDAVKAAYKLKRWGLHDGDQTFEQCRREARKRAATLVEGEGCVVHGTVEVARSSGNLHIAPVSSAQHTARGAPIAQPRNLRYIDVSHFNVTHTINRLSFGDDFPGQVSPLDGVERRSPAGPGVARYFIKVVPTVYTPLAGDELRSNQFASTEHFKPVREDDRIFQVPGIHFSYDVTPLRVRITERRGRTFVSFFVRCAATIGGVFTVAGMVDKIFYSSQRLLMKKLEIGKAS